MKKIILSIFLALGMLFACEKETTVPSAGPESADGGLKSANIVKNDVIVDQIKASLFTYFEGMELQDYDLMRSVAHESFYALEQGVFCKGVEEHIAWFASLTMPPIGVYHFDLDIQDILVKGDVAWIIYFDHLIIGGNTAWNGLESATLIKDRSVWKLVMMTVDNLAPCPECP